MRFKMNIARFSILIVTSAVLAACAQKGATSTGTATAPKPVATVNGEPISATQFDFFVKNIAGKAASELTPEQRSQALDMLVRGEVVAQQAEKDGLDKQGDTPASLDFARLQILEQASMANY